MDDETCRIRSSKKVPADFLHLWRALGFNCSGVLEKNIIGEIGDVVLDRIQGRTDTDQTTVFKSVGTAVQDLVTANRIYDKSISDNFGTEFRLYE